MRYFSGYGNLCCVDIWRCIFVCSSICDLSNRCELVEASGIPKRFLPGTIALGAFTFTMTALPGSPQIQNTIPMKFFGTDAFAAPILGLIASLIMAVGGIYG